MKIKSILMLVSIVLNIVLVGIILFKNLEGTPEIKNGRYGVLKDNMAIGRFGENKKIFSLPKGLMVRDASAAGMDWFEPNRFRLVITSEQDKLIDYSINQDEAKSKNGEYYSADIKNGK
jgi:hypothetical protein